METRGPFKCATTGMADWQREYWWKAVGEIELQIARIPRLARGKKDLGPAMPTVEMGRTICHRKRKQGDRGAEVEAYEYPVSGTISCKRLREADEADDGPLDWMPNPFKLRHPKGLD